MSGVLVLTGLALEARALAAALGLPRVPGGPRAHYRGPQWEVLAVGPGAAALAARVRACRWPALVISAGVCGGLAPALAPGALVVPEVVLEADGTRWTTDPLDGLPRGGALLSPPAVVGPVADKARLHRATGALAVDLESAPVLRWARAHGLAAAVVRAVADPADRALAPELAAALGPDGRVRLWRALGAALARPRAGLEALALGRAVRAALARVAAALARVADGVPATAG